MFCIVSIRQQPGRMQNNAREETVGKVDKTSEENTRTSIHPPTSPPGNTAQGRKTGHGRDALKKGLEDGQRKLEVCGRHAD